MRLTALPCVLLFVAGCVPMAPRMYIPANGETTAILGRNCTFSYKSTLFSREGVLIAITLLPRDELLAGTVQVDVLANHILIFQDTNLIVASPSLGAVQLAPMRGGRYTADKPIEGFALTEFDFISELPTSPSAITVSLPRMVIDGQTVSPQPARFELKRQPTVVGLCQ